MLKKEFAKEWFVRFMVVVFAALWMALLAASWADAAEPDEYSFSWLDPDKKIYVLQNRKFTKAKRLLISAMVGPGFSNSYRTTYNLDPRISYYMSEQFGFELFYTVSNNSTNKTFTALRGTYSNVWPTVREIKTMMGGLVHWVPWYAKINVFNQILYFDWYFSGGLGTIQSSLHEVNDVATDENLTGFFLGTGHQYYLSRDWTVRLDFSSAIYRAQIGRTEGDAWFSNLNFSFGIGYRL